MLRRPLALVFALVVVLVLGAAGCVRGVGTPQEPFVEKLEFRGVRSVDEDDLAAKLATQGPVSRTGITGVLVKELQRLDPDALQTDRRRIEAYLRERGYYQARVESVDVVPERPGLVRVVFHVKEGSPLHVTKVTVSGLDQAPDAQRKLGKLPIAPGQVFTEGAYDAARGAIQNALLTAGWASAAVTQSAVVMPEAGTAEVSYEVRAGPRFRFGPIFVAGSSGVPRDRIRQQVTGAIKTGDWWDESRLATAQQRVFELGVFGGVRVTRGTPDLARGEIPVVVAVREAPFRTLRAGPGVGFQANRWEAHALVGWQHRNFLGDLRRVGADLRVGYAWLPNPYSPVKAGPVALLAGDFRQPGAFTRYVDTSARLEVERGVLEAYDFFAERLKLGLPLRIAPRWTFVPSYNLEVYQLSNTAVDTPAGGFQSTSAPVLENCRGSVCLLTYLEQRIAWDGRNDPVNTRRGLYASISVQEAFHVGGYGYRYLRAVPELRAFYPLGRHTVLALRARVGALIPVGESGDPPIVARFMGGGALSMRGYYTSRLSPMVLQRGQWVPVGGNGLADGSLELRFDIQHNLGAAVFLDGGAVASASGVPTAYQTALDPTRAQWAAGVGLRYRTPFGSLRADVAARLPESFRGDVNSRFPPVPDTFWSDGTPHREPIVAVHIALGEAF
ncbi:MAG TPA: BamA/TamA family outer membrane protein [Anaeromyxobacter sp.]